MALGSGLAPMLLIVIGLWLNRGIDFAQWDNFEYFLPSILFAHRRILHGEVALWNQFQNLGEPLHAMGGGGVFYLPYTACTWLVDTVNGDPRWVMNTIVALHAGLAGFGWYALGRSFGARPLFALIAAVSGALSGFALFVGSVWIHTMPNLAWSVWALWAVKELVDFRRPVVPLVVGVVALSAPFHIGHIQPAVYVSVVTGLFGLVYGLSSRRLAARLPWLAAVAVAAALFAMPAVLPTASLLPDTERISLMSRAEFGDRGVLPRALLGLLLPVYGGGDGFIEKPTLITLHAGAWLLPALLAASGAVLMRRRGSKERARAPSAPSAMPDFSRGLACCALLGSAVVALSVGNHAPFYGWTYGIPVWSSLRWPFKLFLHALPALLAAGAVALEIIARQGAPRPAQRLFFLAAALAASVLWLALPGSLSRSVVVTGAFGLAAMVALAWLDRPWGRALLLIAVVLEAGGTTFLVLRADRYKTYAHEKIGSFGPRQLGISNDYRLLPLSPSTSPEAAIQELGLFHSATLGGYYSLTGQRFALTSRRLWSYVPSGVDGLLPRRIVHTYLRSGLLKSFNCGYVLAAKVDTPMVALLDRLPGFRRIAGTPHALVYANRNALPRFYFATEVRPFSRDSVFAGLVGNRAPATCAFVNGATGSFRAMPLARVLRSQWGHERVAAQVTAPRGGYLVVSMTYSPDWVARIDGRPVPLHLTNGAILGVEVPPGSRSVVLSYSPESLRRGLWLSMLGVLILIGAALAAARFGPSDRAIREPA
jgi:membrane protein YfhO